MKEQFNSGVNPDYGVPTPTLVSPAKRQSRSEWTILFLNSDRIQTSFKMVFEGFKTTKLSKGTFKFNPMNTDHRQKFSFQDFISSIK